MKRAVKSTVVIALLVVALLNVFTMLLTSLDLRSRLNWIPAAFLEVESGSMEPTLSVGDLLVVWETPYNELTEGDIVTFHNGNELVTHELIRREGSRLVTKGTANNVEDASIGPEEYCAKVLYVIPKAGAILEALTTPMSLALSILLILFLFYGMPLLRKVSALLEKTETEAYRPGMIRVAASIAAVSVFAVTPFLTAAKYTAQINKYTEAVAAAKYFSSNYISEEGTKYDIQGWNGKAYNVALALRNYDNDLLFNKTGHDLTYGIRLVKVTGGEFKDDYTLSLIPSAGVQTVGGQDDDTEDGAAFTFSPEWPAGSDYGPYVLTGDSAGGKSNGFTVSIEVDQDGDQYALEGGDKIRFQIYAGTEADYEYYQELKGEFTLTVATASSFLGQQSGDTSIGSSLVTYTLKTNQVGNSNCNVKVSWNKDKLYINQYETTIQNLKSAYPANLVLDDGDGRGYAILPLQAYSSISLQFFKYDANADVSFTGYSDADIYAVEESEPGSGIYPVPENPTPSDPPDIPGDDIE